MGNKNSKPIKPIKPIKDNNNIETITLVEPIEIKIPKPKEFFKQQRELEELEQKNNTENAKKEAQNILNYCYSQILENFSNEIRFKISSLEYNFITPIFLAELLNEKLNVFDWKIKYFYYMHNGIGGYIEVILEEKNEIKTDVYYRNMDNLYSLISPTKYIKNNI